MYNQNTEKIDIMSLTPEELEELVISVGEKKYRAAQIFPQLHKGISIDEMTNVGKATREKLEVVSFCHIPKIKTRLPKVNAPNSFY